MRRSLPVAAIAATTLLVALSAAACGGSNTSSSGTTSASTVTTTTSAAASDAAAAWVDKVCGEVVKLTEAQPPAPPNLSSDPAQSLKAFDQYMAANIDIVDKTIANLRNVGPSPIPGADQDLNKLIDGLTSLRQGYQTTRDKFATINPRDSKAAQSAMMEAFASLSKGGEELSQALNSVSTNKEIEAAGKNAPNCQKLDTGTSTTATSTS
jgi:hypothetical protein